MSIRSDPFEVMERMFERMRRTGFREDPFAVGHEGTTFDANVSIERIDDEFVVLADLPGFEREEIALTYANDALTISGTHEEGDGGHYRSRHVRESVAVPDTVDHETIEASYKNGVLEVRLPVVEADDAGHRIVIE